MSTLPVVEDAATHPVQAPTRTQADYAICLPSMPSDALHAMVGQLRSSLPGQTLLIASPDQAEDAVLEGDVQLVPYPVPRTGSEWVLDATDYLAAARLTQARGLKGVVLLGSEAMTLGTRGIMALQQACTSGADLAIPRYHTGPEDGLVNSALLYPLTRALFGIDIHFPLPLDAALSTRMLGRLAVLADRVVVGGDSGLVWPVAEASIAGLAIREVDGVERAIPRPQETDLNVLFPAVCSSLFTDVENKATYWQRARTLPASRPQAASVAGSEAADMGEVQALAEGFRLAFSNLREIWSLVLPPQSLLSLKKLSVQPAESFVFPPNLWARTVYDFALAFHMRTLNRGHLLGAMTPLYLAWVASLLREAGTGTETATLQATANAFEQEKPYMVSRWRWPDRFNP